MNNLGEIVLLRDEDRGKTIFNREDVITIIKVHNGIEDIGGYYNMILNKMISYERDARIDNLLKKEEEIKWS